MHQCYLFDLIWNCLFTLGYIAQKLHKSGVSESCEVCDCSVFVADGMQLIIALHWVTKPLFSDLGLVLHGHRSAIPYPCCSAFVHVVRCQTCLGVDCCCCSDFDASSFSLYCCLFLILHLGLLVYFSQASVASVWTRGGDFRILILSLWLTVVK